MTPERRDDLGRPHVLPGDLADQVREAIRRELHAWGYRNPDVPTHSLATDLCGAVFALDAMQDTVAALDRVRALAERNRSQPFIYTAQLDRALEGDHS